MIRIRKKQTLLTLLAAAFLFLLCTAPSGAAEVSDFTDLQTAINSGGVQTIYVTSDIEMQPIKIPAGSDITIKPSGKSVTLSFSGCSSAKNEAAFITVPAGGNLTLSGDSGHTLTIKGSLLSGNAVPLIYNKKGNLSIEAGTVLTSHSSTEEYGGIRNNGRVIMNGGEISACSGSSSGAVSLVNAGSTFVMNGGEIWGNSGAAGGGVQMKSGTVFQMSGGSITGNTGSDLYIQGEAAAVTVSSTAVIESVHFLNKIRETPLSFLPITVREDFLGEIHQISVEEYVSNMKIAEFTSAADAERLQTKLTAVDTYQLTPSDNYLVLTLAPALQFVLDNSEYTIIPSDAVSIPVSLEVVSTKVSLINITAAVLDAGGNPVSGLTYTYAVKDKSPFTLVSTNGAVLTLSTGHDITADIDELFVLTIEKTETLREGETYTISFTIESSVSNAEDYTRYPEQILQAEVSIIPLILETDDNIDGTDKFGNSIWSFADKATYTYIISPHDGTLSLPWPTVSRNSSASYQNAAAELTEVAVYKSLSPYRPDSTMQWVSAASSVSKNADGTINFIRSANDADAEAFKLVFTGRKLGDVVEGTGDINKVNLYDIDMILHAAVDSSRYIKPVWRLYADADSDGLIQLSDAIAVFNFIRGYV